MSLFGILKRLDLLCIMKSIIIFAIALSLATLSRAEVPDSTFRKTGFSFGALPAIAFDQDLGFQYGVLTNMYWYGDGSKYPLYNHSLYLEASRNIGGTTLLRAYYDTRTLINNIRLTADITWYDDLTTDFFGFNGYQAKYNSKWTDDGSDQYVSRVFYQYERAMFRLMFNLRGNLSKQSHFYWQGGAVAFNMKQSSVDLSKLRRSVPDVPGLYDKYIDWGIIKPKEADGGFNTYIRAGIGYDSRDNESFPIKGIWTEVLLAYSPSLFSSDNHDYGKLTVYHRQYFKLNSKNLVLAYRLGWQHKLWGDTPFYLLPHWNTSVLTAATSQGLGGSKTLRGIKRNRIIGDGSVMANIELRYVFYRFNVLKQEISLGTNLFADMGMVTQDYKIDKSKVPDEEYYNYFGTEQDALHSSAGIGLKVAMNSNFVVSVDYGKAMDKRDGTSGFYVLMNYLF